MASKPSVLFVCVHNASRSQMAAALLTHLAGDLVEAEAAIERLAVREIWLLRLRALLARARGDAAAYAHFRDRYRNTARTLGFEGHIAWAEAMT